MRKLVLAAAIVLCASPALAKDVTITLNDEEQKVFLAMLDVVVKQGGLSSIQAVSKFLSKYQAAISGPSSSSPDNSATPSPDPAKK